MTVDPEIAAMLEAGKALCSLPIDHVPLEDLRNGYRQRYHERSIEPEAPVRIEEIAMAEGSEAFSV